MLKIEPDGGGRTIHSGGPALGTLPCRATLRGALGTCPAGTTPGGQDRTGQFRPLHLDVRRAVRSLRRATARGALDVRVSPFSALSGTRQPELGRREARQRDLPLRPDNGLLDPP